MKGHDQVVAALNDVLTSELTAINQYFIHARMCENWGYQRLWKKLREESGVPNLQKLGKVTSARRSSSSSSSTSRWKSRRSSG